MNNQFTEEDKAELQRRRLVDEVSKSVEETLKRRYTWLAIVVSFILGSGVILATNQLTKSTTDTLTRHQVLLEQAEDSLEKVNKLAESAQQRLEAFQSEVNDKVEVINKDISGVSEGKISLNERLSETLYEINRINQRVDDLSKAINALSQNKVVIESDTRIENNISSTLAKTIKGKYTVYVHYKEDKNRSSIEYFANYLKELGYTVPRIRKVDYKVKDIRYYYMSDEEEASELKKITYQYFNSKKSIAIDLSVKYFGDSYKNVRKGVIEFWVYLN